MFELLTPGVASSLIAMGIGGACGWTLRFLREAARLKPESMLIDRFLGKGNVTVYISEKGRVGECCAPSTSIPEVIGFSRLQMALGERGIPCKLSLSHVSAGDAVGTGVVCIGGPTYNPTTRSFLGALGLGGTFRYAGEGPYEGQASFCFGDREFRSIVEEGPEGPVLVRDYALVVSAPFKGLGAGRALLVMGLYSVATGAALDCLHMPGLWDRRRLPGRDESLIAIIEVDAIDGGATAGSSRVVLQEVRSSGYGSHAE